MLHFHFMIMVLSVFSRRCFIKFLVFCESPRENGGEWSWAKLITEQDQYPHLYQPVALITLFDVTAKCRHRIGQDGCVLTSRGEFCYSLGCQAFDNEPVKGTVKWSGRMKSRIHPCGTSSRLHWDHTIIAMNRFNLPFSLWGSVSLIDHQLFVVSAKQMFVKW